MRIAGIYPQAVELDLALDPDPDEPLGIAYILARAAQDGHNARLFIPHDGGWDRFWRDIGHFQPDVVAVSLLTKHVDIGRDIARRIRQQFAKALLVAGGSHPTVAPGELFPAFNVCVIGEGEETFADILKAHGVNQDFLKIRGVALPDRNGNLIFSDPRDRIRHADDLPWPIRDFRFFSKEAWGINYLPGADIRFASTLFSRGCPFSCKYCSSVEHWGRKVTFRSPRNVIAEIRDLKDRYGVNFISFADLTFTVSRKRVLELCDELMAADLGIRWQCETSVETADRELLSGMRAAGCTKICWGIEASNASSLEAIGRRHTSDLAQDALAWSESQGIFNWAFTIMGFPWQGEEEIVQDYIQLANLPIHQLRVSIATPFPGTEWASSFPPLSDRRYEHFDTNCLVYSHPTLTPERMKSLQSRVLYDFYNDHRYDRRMRAMAGRFPDLRCAIVQFRSRVDEWLTSSQFRKSVNGGEILHDDSRVVAREFE